MTSHAIVAATRRRFGRGVKVGHAGTLDPFATGLLLVLVGRATRAQRYLMELPKTYRAVAHLAHVSDTGDSDGQVTRTGRLPARLELATGEIWQRPPAYSAVKVGGERLYRRARRGDPVEGEPRRVRVGRADLLWAEGERAAFEIECSAGTYVRQLIADLGDAYCERLERVAIGPFALADADEERIVPLRDALAFIPGVELAAGDAEAVSHGRGIALDGEALASMPGGGGGGTLRLTHAGRLIALGRAVDGSTIRPEVVLEPGAGAARK